MKSTHHVSGSTSAQLPLERSRAPQSEISQPTQLAPAVGTFAELIERAAQEILVVTHWFDPTPYTTSAPITVRFTGHRVGVEGPMQPSDRFIHDETIMEIVPRSGPISITARIRDLHPGEWVVNAHVIESVLPKRRRQARAAAAPTNQPFQGVARVWQRWAPSANTEQPIHTCTAPFARVPGLLPSGTWGFLVGLGMVVALLIQALVISRDHLAADSAWAITLAAIGVGIIGAKVWYRVLHHSTRRWDGWCIQGFIAAATVTTAVQLILLRVPAGAFLDATAPGLLLGLAVGRVGCFFAGCCGGPPTASRWGVWSSNQVVGARRVPTQLLEVGFCLILGLSVLGLVLARGPAGAAYFAASIAAYTLGRQGILHLRAEPRKTRLGGLITAVVTALVLLGASVVIIL